MLQIITWLGCFYLVIKGLQLLQQSQLAPERSSARSTGYIGFILSLLGAAFFVYIAGQQVQSSGALGGSMLGMDARSAGERGIDSLTPEHQAQLEDAEAMLDDPVEVDKK